MDRDTKRLLVVFSVLLVVMVLLFLLSAGFDISGTSVRKGIQL